MTPRLLELLLTIGRINRVYDDEATEDARSSIFVEPGYWKDVRFLSNSTLSTTALVVCESESGLTGTIVERTYNLSDQQESIEISNEVVKDWIGEEAMQYLSTYSFTTSTIEF